MSGGAERDVWLVGPRGAGKTTVGRVLAHRLARPFVDTDEIVTARLGVSIADFFAKSGEDEFRIREAAVVAELEKGRGRVIAAGGGVPLLSENQERLRATGLVCFLDVDAGRASSRVPGSGGGRPRLTADAWSEEMRRIVAERRPVYRAVADVVVDADPPVETVLALLLEALAAHGIVARA